MLEYNDTAIHTIQSQSACQHSSFVNSPYRQSYGQYSKLFYDVKSDTDLIGGLVGDSDDENL
ncbi:MAG: hypothetical protein LBD11_07960 [Candidatus Peribacteria bacterium]|jgi:hypothetical protein|nr:hypothetical protein [Candidatus Peribacteria bacterium]